MHRLNADTGSPTNSPFIVGVSGHRDLDAAHLSQLRAAVIAFVQQLRLHLPDTELRLIVGMAAGADLLVAETAVALGVTVEAVLPMPLDDYAADFDAQTLDCLRALLRDPHVHCTELGMPAGAMRTLQPHSPAQRDAMYANLTATLVRRSSLLLALWDGKSSPLPGGTADTVLRFLGVRTDTYPATGPLEFATHVREVEVDDRLVYWMPAPRQNSAQVPQVSTPCFLLATGDSVLHVEPEMPASLARQLAEFDSYNREFRELSAAGQLPRDGSLLAGLSAPLPATDSALLRRIDAEYVKADTLAVYYQRRSDRLFHVFAALAFATGLAYLAYEKITESRLALGACALVLLLGLAIYDVSRGRRWFGKHLAYRALAETLRALFYLRLAGADRAINAEEVLALSGIDRFRGFGWISFILKGIEPADTSGTAGDPDALGAREVGRAWIDDQHSYFTHKVARLERGSRRVHRLRRALLATLLLAICALLLFGEELRGIRFGPHIPLTSVLSFSVGLIAVLLAVWELHEDKLATRELLWQYRNQLSHFARARAHLARMTVPVRRAQLLAELGKDSLMESYLWAIHRYHRYHREQRSSPGRGA